MSEIFSRRSFLKLSGSLVVASALAACSDGGGGNGGSGGGSGGGDIDTSKWYDVGDGLQISGSVGIGATTLAQNNYTYLSLNFKKNSEDSTQAVTKNDFSAVTIDGRTATVAGVGISRGNFVDSTSISSKATSVLLYFTPIDGINSLSGKAISFCCSHNNSTKVRFTRSANNTVFTVEENI